MSNYAKLVNGLETLGLTGIKSCLDSYIELINSGEKSVVDALYEMVNNEIEQNKIRAVNSCVKVANFPFLKHLSDFDFPFQPSINKQELLDLAALRFVEKRENILFVGSSGVGKTHLATSIGIECATQRYSTYFISFQELINQLTNALKENRLEARMKFFSRYKILIIDEIGYIPVNTDTANLFFQLVAKRYEKHCTIITTNTVFSKWGEIFGSATIANAILDRLLHHSHVISIKGPSYRLRDKLNFFEGGSCD